MVSIEKKKELLLKPVWTYTDIMDYLDVSSTKAFTIKKEAIKNGGSVQYGVHYVKCDTVLKLYGTSREEELQALGKVLNEEKV